MLNASGQLVGQLRRLQVTWRVAPLCVHLYSLDSNTHVFVLSNGERICDVAGNAFSWVFVGFRCTQPIGL